MSAPTQPTDRRAVSAHTPTFGSLLRAELLRVRSRRFARWMVVGLFLVLALATVLEFRDSAKPTEASITEAQGLCSAMYSGSYGYGGDRTFYDESGRPTEVDLTTVPVVPECDTVSEAAANDGFPKGERPAMPSELPGWFIGIGVVVGIVVFIFGATLGGADWSNRTMPALLFWEPRRWRVYAAKVTALAIGVLTLLVASCLVWAAVYSVLISVHGTWSDGSTGLLGDGLRSFAAAGALCAVAALVGFGIANLTRNTGAALGAAFVYFVIAETAATAFAPWLLPWLFNLNLGALLTDGGLHEEVNGQLVSTSSLRGGLTLLGYAAVLNLAALTLFKRRDVT
jgi:hypothetical protein